MKQSFIILINFITLYSFVKIRCNYFVSLRPKFISKQCNFNYKIFWFCIKWSLSISRCLCTIIATLVLTAFLKAQLWWSLSRGRAPDCQFCGIHKGNKKKETSSSEGEFFLLLRNKYTEGDFTSEENQPAEDRRTTPNNSENEGGYRWCYEVDTKCRIHYIKLKRL